MDQLFWGLTWANLIAFGGVVVTFALGVTNYFANRSTRRNALALDTFGHRVRAPVEKLFETLDGIMDEADDIDRSEQTFAEKIAATKALKVKFHAVRRKLARLLTDCDKSSLIAGNDWSRLDEGHMDTATEALDRGARSDDAGELHQNLLSAAQAIDRLRSSTGDRLDAHAKSLMR